jgi:hypothetical protein
MLGLGMLIKLKCKTKGKLMLDVWSANRAN